MTDPEQDRIAAAFESELARTPVPPGLRAQAVRGAVHRGSHLDRIRPPWALQLVAAVVAVAIVVTLVIGERALHLRSSIPGASPSAAPTGGPSLSPNSPLALSEPAFHDGEVGVQYAPVTLSASGGAPPYQWTIPSGSLPDGLTIDANGVVSGTPTAAGVASFTVRVVDSKNSTMQVKGSLTIASALIAGYQQRCAGGTCVAEVGCTGGPAGSTNACGGFGYVSGGSPPYSFSVTGGTLPPGPSLNGLTLDGLFIQGGTFTFEVTVSDGLGGKAVLAPTFKVVGRIWVSGGSCVGDYSTGCSVRLAISGGVGTPTVGVSVYLCTYGCTPPYYNDVPPGFSAVVSGNSVIITFPKGMVNGWKGVIYVQLADQYRNNAMAPGQVDVNVTPAPGH